jgi:hypothetical protein
MSATLTAEEEFLLALSELTIFPEEIIEYRIHYNDNNVITMCSMQNHPETMQYLVVDKVTYDNYFSYIIVDGKLKRIDNNPGYTVQLIKSTQGVGCVKHHAGIILENNETYLNTEYYEFRNS